MAGKDLEKFIEKYPTYIDALEMLEQKDQRIAELEQDLEFTTKTANDLIEIKHKLEQELAELKEKMQEEISRREIYFISWLGNKVCKGYVIGYNEEDKFIIICGEDMISTNEIFTYEQEAQTKLQELRGGE